MLGFGLSQISELVRDLGLGIVYLDKTLQHRNPKHWFRPVSCTITGLKLKVVEGGADL